MSDKREGASEVNCIPRVGITTYRAEVTWATGRWRHVAAFIPEQYLDFVTAGGGAPVLLAPSRDGARAVVAGVDALILSGGPDVSPSSYRASRDPLCEVSDPNRDSWEFQVLDSALERNIPVLGICRGIHILNAAYGGTLHQHLPLVSGNNNHRVSVGTFTRNRIESVHLSRLSQIIGKEIRVPCHHHQSVATLGEGLSVAARAEDGIIEAVEAQTDQFVVGVQWHPEEDSDFSLSRALVAAAVEHRNEAESG